MLQNGKLYIDKTTTPNKGISLHEISKCLGVASQDLGTLVQHKRNNMGSKKKPVEGGNNVDINYDISDGGKGIEKNCGISAPKRVSSFNDVLMQYDGFLNGGNHVKPKTRFRQNDYNGYYHYAKPPIIGMDSESQYFKFNNSNIEVSISYNDDDVDENGSGSLKMSDLTFDGMPLSEGYIGIAIFTADKTLCKGYIATQKGAEIETLYYPNNELQEGIRYLLVPFYSKVRLSFNSGDALEQSLMSIPIVQPVEFIIRNPNSMLSINAEFDGYNSNNITIIVTNNNSSSVNIEKGNANARLMLKRDDFYSSDDYGNSNMNSTDYEFELNITYVPGIKDCSNVYNCDATHTITIPNNLDKSLDYILLVRIYTAGINFDLGPEEVRGEIENA